MYKSHVQTRDGGGGLGFRALRGKVFHCRDDKAEGDPPLVLVEQVLTLYPKLSAVEGWEEPVALQQNPSVVAGMRSRS